ncbi:MAG: phosphoribosylamine--glycine ligase [bacterium]
MTTPGASGLGTGWDLQVGPKKTKKPEEPTAASTDGTELTVNPKKAGHAPQNGPVVGGAEELPGTPRRAPGPTSEDPNKGKKSAAPATDDFTKQRPGTVEEDAEVYVSPQKGGAGWVTPSGKPVDPAVAPAKPAAASGKPGEPPGETSLYEDDDVEVTSSPRRPEPTAAHGSLNFKSMTGGGSGSRPGAGAAMGGGIMPSRANISGEDSELYVRKPGESSVKPAKDYGMTPRAPPTSDGDTVVYVGRTAQGQGPPHRSQPGRVLLVGGGGREHAMAMALRRSNAEVYAVLKHRNPGIVKLATGFRLLEETNVPAVVEWARGQKVELAVIGPEGPLAAGLADALADAGIPVASPSRAAAQIESDKSFMRSLMAKHNLPGQLGFHPFDNLEGALRFLDEHGPVWAIKPVGLTGGKGVQVHGDHFTDNVGAKAYTRSIFTGKVGGGRVQFEELARGEEFTVMAFCDGTNLAPMPAVQDHKRLKDGDQGPNTGGMGSYSQGDGLLPFLTQTDYDEAVHILQGIVAALRTDGTPYVGAIYGQFMLTAAGPKVIEVNARFGDPEAMNVLHLMESNYLDVLRAMIAGKLGGATLAFRPRATVVKYVVPKGYGEGNPRSGSFVQVDEFNVKRGGASVYYANIEQLTSGSLSTMPSRSLAMLGEGATVEEANALCEAALKHVHGDHLYVRHDIGTAELLAKRVAHMAEERAGATPPRRAARAQAVF